MKMLYLASEASPRWLHLPSDKQELKFSPRWFKSYLLNQAFDERVSSFSGMCIYDDGVDDGVFLGDLFGTFTTPIKRKNKLAAVKNCSGHNTRVKWSVLMLDGSRNIWHYSSTNKQTVWNFWTFTCTPSIVSINLHLNMIEHWWAIWFQLTKLLFRLL